MHPEAVNENIVPRVLMITFKISKFVARYGLEPIYSVDGSDKLQWEAIHGVTEEEVLKKVVSKIEQYVDCPK